MENKLKQSQAEDEAIDYYSNVADPFQPNKPHTKSNPLQPHQYPSIRELSFQTNYNH